MLQKLQLTAAHQLMPLYPNRALPQTPGASPLDHSTVPNPNAAQQSHAFSNTPTLSKYKESGMIEKLLAAVLEIASLKKSVSNTFLTFLKHFNCAHL